MTRLDSVPLLVALALITYNIGTSKADQVNEDLKMQRRFLQPNLIQASKRKDHHFDILILTQHWPYTTCIDWESGSGHQCREIGKYPSQPPSRHKLKIHFSAHANWSLHGLWPTQMGRIAPSFCNKTWKFEHKVLEPIMDEMNLYWPDVEMRGQPDSLSQHQRAGL